MLHFAFLMLGRLPNSSEPSPEGGSGIGTREWGSSRRGPARGPATSASLISVGLRRCSKILLICLQQICNCLGALTLCTVLVGTGNTSALDLVGLSVTRMWDRLQKLVEFAGAHRGRCGLAPSTIRIVDVKTQSRSIVELRLFLSFRVRWF